MLEGAELNAIILESLDVSWSYLKRFDSLVILQLQRSPRSSILDLAENLNC